MKHKYYAVRMDFHAREYYYYHLGVGGIIKLRRKYKKLH